MHGSQARRVANLLGLAVLAYLVEGPKHPYEVGRLLRAHDDARSIKFNPGSLYTVFGQLARAGFIAELETVREGQRPERTVYGLTDAGRTELDEWMRELVQAPKHEYPSFVAALSLITALPPAEVAMLLARRAEALAEARDEIRARIDDALAGGLDPVFLVEEDYRLALLDAESAFVARFIEQINEPEAEFGLTWRTFHKERKT
jgi:DNA-binding PadR family transcriptional regulator